jgi:hypothetical protein
VECRRLVEGVATGGSPQIADFGLRNANLKSRGVESRKQKAEGSSQAGVAIQGRSAEGREQ